MGDMDSGNSGSMQSSSTGGGDDQEYESSRGDVASFPSLFNPPNYPVNPFDNARLLQLYSINNGSSSSGGMLDQQQAQQRQGQVHFDSLEMSPNFMPGGGSNNHMEMVWANKFGSFRSSDETTCTPTSTTGHGYETSGNPMSSLQVHLGPPPSLPNLQGSAAATGSGVPSTENSPRSSAQNQNANSTNLAGLSGGRNPKKRSRASRRAPTTVLTTDTSNFRQMVQEFTGIPAPPFSTPGFSTSTRLDLFGGLGMGMGMGMGMGIGLGTATGTGMGMGILPRPAPGGGGVGSSSTNSLDPPSYLLRPFAQKPVAHPTSVQPHQPNSGASNTTTPSALAEATVGASSDGNTSNSIICCSTSNGTTMSSSFHLPPQNVLQPANPMFSFQSLLQPSSNQPASDKYPPPLVQQDSAMDNLGSKGAGSSAAGGGPSEENEPQSWASLRQGLGLTQTDHAHDHHHLSSHQTNNSVNAGVGNLMSSSGTDTGHSQLAGAPINGTSDNHGGVVRGEPGMVDSWICSSD